MITAVRNLDMDITQPADFDADIIVTLKKHARSHEDPKTKKSCYIVEESKSSRNQTFLLREKFQVFYESKPLRNSGVSDLDFIKTLFDREINFEDSVEFSADSISILLQTSQKINVASASLTVAKPRFVAIELGENFSIQSHLEKVGDNNITFVIISKDSKSCQKAKCGSIGSPENTVKIAIDMVQSETVQTLMVINSIDTLSLLSDIIITATFRNEEH